MDNLNEKVELNEEELESVTGGKISFEKRPDRAGWTQHKVQPGDTLIRIAQRYNVISYKLIIKWNPHIDRNTNIIVDGEYLWVLPNARS